MAVDEFDDADLAVVMTGGGARAAYQVGCLRWIARHNPEQRIAILTGVSAGAINAVFLAGRRGPFARRVEELTELWCGIRVEDIFEVGTPGLVRNVLRWGSRLVSGGGLTAPSRGMVDTAPLRKLLTQSLHVDLDEISGIALNLSDGPLRAVALTTTSYTTGRSVTWVQGRRIREWERPNRMSRSCRLGVEHVMASSSLPFLFPPIAIENAWHGDGGIRLTTPLAPAVHLGARRILAITTRYAPSVGEAARLQVTGHPPPAQIAGILLNAIFLDRIDGDAQVLNRINRLIADIPGERREGLRPVGLLVLRPSRDLGRMANDFESTLPRGFRFFTRGLGTRQTQSNDLLSLLMFQSDYLQRLIELGERDAEARGDEIAGFLSAGVCVDGDRVL